MSRAGCFVLTAIAALACWAPGPVVNPLQTLGLGGELPPLLPDTAHVFGSVAAALHLGSSSALIQQLENRNSIERGWVLPGQMQGRGHEWTTQSRHLVFNMSVQQLHGPKITVRYEVNSGSLVNLTELALAERRHDEFVPDVAHSF